MKLNILLAALAATVVSALPTSNTTPAAVGLQKRACVSTTFEWAVWVDGKNQVQNGLTFMVDKYNSHPYHTSTFTIARAKGANSKKNCHPNKEWCVDFAGYEKSEKVTVTFLNRNRVYNAPNLRTPVGGNKRDTFQYWDCVPFVQENKAIRH
ncbi:hypothetical protein BGW39_011307 [Mortierella sp. 14UC]|nr:hypothetical protein BGW39_011307 [Mortierella sp. 14UC]